MIWRLVLVGFVLAASALAGAVAVWWGINTIGVCDGIGMRSDTGCVVTDRFVDWGAGQAVVFALIAVALLSLVRYLVRGARRWLVTALVLAAAFVVVPVALMAPAAFDETGPVQLLSFLDG